MPEFEGIPLCESALKSWIALPFNWLSEIPKERTKEAAATREGLKSRKALLEAATLSNSDAISVT